MRYAGIDYGTKNIGIAFSDEEGTMGFPHGVLSNDSKLLSQVRTLCAEKEVGMVVIGDSHMHSGALNPVAELARAFGKQFSEESGIPVVYESEAFTTAQARRSPEGQWEKKGKDIDAKAAALILTSYLSHHDND